MTTIKDLYLNPKNQGSLMGISTFAKAQKLKDIKEVKRQLSELDNVSLIHPVRKRFKRRKVMVHFNKWLFCVDLMESSVFYKNAFVNKNQRLNFCIVVKDMFSKMVWLQVTHLKYIAYLCATIIMFNQRL